MALLLDPDLLRESRQAASIKLEYPIASAREVSLKKLLLHRSITALDNRLVLLAPPAEPVPASFENVDVDPNRHAELIADLQGLRGRIYLRDGAVELPQLTPDGLHQTPEDEKSWHLLMLDRLGRVEACVWYLHHDPSIPAERLRVRHCPLACEPEWCDTLWGAVELELWRARRARIGYAEVGGWAVSESSRGTSAGLVLALAGYSLGAFLGGTLGMTTATVRHCSSAILRRLGGTDLSIDGRTVPSYHDPRYKCEMELLRFDSRRPNPKYRALVELLQESLSEVRVIAPDRQHVQSYNFWRDRTAESFPPAISTAS
jgi:hypothetical protein